MANGSVQPALDVLRWLVRLGFLGQEIHDDDGRLDALYLARSWKGVRDAVIVYSEREVLAYRTRDPWDPRRPFQIDPDGLLWRRHGPLIDVTRTLLALPAPASLAS